MKNYFKVLSLLVILALLSGCNLYKGLDKPTDKEEAKFNEKQALKKGDFAAAITSLEARLDSLSGEEKTEAITTLADSYLEKAGVNLVDIGSTIATSTTSGGTSSNASLVKTLNNINFDDLEKADSYYDQLLADEEVPAAVLKRGGSSNTDSKKKELYLSAAFAKALLAAHYLAIVIYPFDESSKIKIVINADGSASAYSMDDLVNAKDPRSVEDMKAQWVAKTKKNVTYGKTIITHLGKVVKYIGKALDDEDGDINETVNEYYNDIAKYGNATTVSELDKEFTDLIESFTP